MINLEPVTQTKLFGLNKYMSELIELSKNKVLPNKILLSGLKGCGKSTLAYHFINYNLSKDEEFNYDSYNFQINPKNKSFKTVINKSNLNLTVIDLNLEKKSIEINQIRELIINLHKSSFNNKPRFVLIDNIEFLNINSINALLKILEEPTSNAHFILINNNKRILPTLASRCINFKISLTNKDSLFIINKLLDEKLYKIVNDDLINYYLTPGNVYNLVKFAEINEYNLTNLSLRDFLKILIKNKHYKKNILNEYIVFDLIESYFRKINLSFSSSVHKKYSYFLKKFYDTKKFNLDEDSLFIEFEENVLNG